MLIKFNVIYGEFIHIQAQTFYLSQNSTEHYAITMTKEFMFSIAKYSNLGLKIQFRKLHY